MCEHILDLVLFSQNLQHDKHQHELCDLGIIWKQSSHTNQLAIFSDSGGDKLHSKQIGHCCWEAL